MKTSKITGWSHHNQLHNHDNHHPKAHHEWMTNYTGSTTTATSTAIITPTSNTTPKEPATNTSLDSGVAGLRDTPVHTPIISNNNNMPGPKNANSPTENEEYNVPKFIVDQTTRTTYMKGRFLGKVCKISVEVYLKSEYNLEITCVSFRAIFFSKFLCRYNGPHAVV